MRITNQSMNKSFLRNLNNNLKQMQKYQNQLSSGKEVSKPSDNPLLVGKIMGLDTQISQNEQYNGNISDSIGWVRTQDTALSEASDAMRRIKELALRGANDTLADDDRAAIKHEVEQQVEHLVDVFNTSFDGRYVFAGQATDTRPFEVKRDDDGKTIGIKHTGVDGDGMDKNLEREIGNGVTVNLVTSGDYLIKDSNSEKELGDILGGLLKALSSDEKDPSGEINNLLADIDSHASNVVRVRTRIGAIDNRLESSLARNEAENINLKKILSENEDIDIAEKYMESVVASTIYQASLSIGSKVIQPTLLDFIR